MTSFPFMQVARMRGLPYDVVLRIADHIEGHRIAAQSDLDVVGMSDWKWIHQTCMAERKRRKDTSQ